MRFRWLCGRMFTPELLCNEEPQCIGWETKEGRGRITIRKAVDMANGIFKPCSLCSPSGKQCINLVISNPDPEYFHSTNPRDLGAATQLARTVLDYLEVDWQDK